MIARRTSLWLAAALLLAASLPAGISAASPSVNCAPNTSGNWSAITWTCGHTPGIGGGVGDDVTINKAVSQDIDVSIGSLTLGGGFTTVGSETMTLSGNWMKTTTDSYNTGTGTVIFAGPGPQTIGGAVRDDLL